MNAPPPALRAPYSQRRSNATSTTSAVKALSIDNRQTSRFGPRAPVSPVSGSTPVGTALQVVLTRLADGLFASTTCHAVLATLATSVMRVPCPARPPPPPARA